jgi:heptosyltransferase-1
VNVAILKLSALGDAICALPLAANLHRAGHRVVWIVESRLAELIEGNPNVDGVLVVDTRRWRRRPLAVSTWAQIGRFRRQIATFRPEVLLDAQGNEKSWAISLAVRAPRLVLDDRSVRRAWTRRLSAGRVAPAAAARHVTDRALALLSALGVRVVERAPDARYLLRGAGEASRRFLESVPRPYALYHPGAGWANKCWGERRYAELARTVRDRWGLFPVVSWGPGDEARAARLSGELEAPSVPAGCRLADLAAIVSEASLFAGGDTGPLHLADALGVRTLSIYGPTDPVRNGPYRSAANALSAGLACSPCNARYRGVKPCLARIGVPEAARAAARELGRA